MAYGATEPDLTGIDMASLSQVRRDILKKWLPMVLPSNEGSPKFDNLMTHASCAARRAENANFTTCGSLPGWLFQRIGAAASLANYGLAGVRDAAEALGCWASNSVLHRIMYESAYHAPRLPRPGDVFLQGGLGNDAEILHIGVIVNPTGKVWVTADAGQGTKEAQAALYCQRSYTAETRELGAPLWHGRPTGASRRLVGWVDIDRAVAMA